jgi:hypothetical protein
MLDNNDLFERIALGAAAGLAATLALQVVRTSSRRILPISLVISSVLPLLGVWHANCCHGTPFWGVSIWCGRS